MTEHLLLYRPTSSNHATVDSFPAVLDVAPAIGSKIATDTQRCCFPLTRCAGYQKRLQSVSDIYSRVGMGRHPAGPSTWARQPYALDQRSTDAVNRKSEVRSTA